MSARSNVALANAEAERIHQLVSKLNTLIDRAAACGVDTSLSVVCGGPGLRATLDVRTTVDGLGAESGSGTNRVS